MFKTIKNALKTPDVRKRLLYTLLLIVVFRFGCYITVPGVDTFALSEQMQSSTTSLSGLINTISGGAFSRLSIFAMSISPYITASIVVQLLGMIIPSLEKIMKEGGEEGKNKINRYTKMITIVLALVEAIGIYISYKSSGIFINSGFLTGSLVILSLITGTAILMWLGDQITNKGLGNGISLIIMAGIVNTIPSMMIKAFNELAINGSNTFIGIISFIIFVLLYIAIIVGVVYVQEAERRIPIQYSNRSTGTYKANSSFLPLRINSAGVMPVIFASAVLAIPTTLTYIIKKDSFKLFVDKYLSTTTPIGFIVYILLIIAFTYGYTYLAAVNPEDLSKNLNKQNGYIPGIRPGTETTKYVSKVLSRITFMGALFIAALAAIPIVFSWVSNMSSTVTLGGTSILIVVGVLLETYKQLESSVASRAYRR